MYNICCIVNDKAYPLGVERILLAKSAIQTTKRRVYAFWFHPHKACLHSIILCSTWTAQIGPDHVFNPSTRLLLVG